MRDFVDHARIKPPGAGLVLKIRPSIFEKAIAIARSEQAQGK